MIRVEVSAWSSRMSRYARTSYGSVESSSSTISRSPVAIREIMASRSSGLSISSEKSVSGTKKLIALDRSAYWRTMSIAPAILSETCDGFVCSLIRASACWNGRASSAKSADW